MTAPLASLPLAQALLDMLTGVLGDTCPVYLGGAPRNTLPAKYAVLFPDTGMKSGFHRNLVNDGPDELRYQVTSVGEGPEQAMWVADKTAGVLLTTVPTVSGRRVWRTVEESVQPLQRDDDSTGLWYVTAQYLTRSDPT